jgi:hypothetical protein
VSCVRKVHDEGLCYIVLIKIVLCVTHVSLQAVKVADRRRRNHFRSVVCEIHVSGSRDRSTYRLENICHFMCDLKFFVHYVIKIVSLITLNILMVKIYHLQHGLVTIKE